VARDLELQATWSDVKQLRTAAIEDFEWLLGGESSHPLATKLDIRHCCGANDRKEPCSRLIDLAKHDHRPTDVSN
jgi:hypothetical protein